MCARTQPLATVRMHKFTFHISFCGRILEISLRQKHEGRLLRWDFLTAVMGLRDKYDLVVIDFHVQEFNIIKKNTGGLNAHVY